MHARANALMVIYVHNGVLWQVVMFEVSSWGIYFSTLMALYISTFKLHPLSSFLTPLCSCTTSNTYQVKCNAVYHMLYSIVAMPTMDTCLWRMCAGSNEFYRCHQWVPCARMHIVISILNLQLYQPTIRWWQNWVTKWCETAPPNHQDFPISHITVVKKNVAPNNALCQYPTCYVLLSISNIICPFVLLKAMELSMQWIGAVSRCS